MSEFFIYYKNNCPWCENAKRLIEAHGDTWSGLNIEDSAENLEEFKADWPGAKTVPQIIDVTDGDFMRIGPFTELVKYYGSSTLPTTPN